MSLVLYYERSTSHNFVVFALYKPIASYFYTQDIWLHLHIQKYLLHALSEGKYKKFNPLRQYDVTEFIYTSSFSTITISASEKKVDCGSISYILRISLSQSKIIARNRQWVQAKVAEHKAQIWNEQESS